MKLYALKVAYIYEWIVIKDSIEEERGAHEEGGKGQIKWHKFNAFCTDHQILGKKIYICQGKQNETLKFRQFYEKRKKCTISTKI